MHTAKYRRSTAEPLGHHIRDAERTENKTYKVGSGHDTSRHWSHSKQCTCKAASRAVSSAVARSLLRVISVKSEDHREMEKENHRLRVARTTYMFSSCLHTSTRNHIRIRIGSRAGQAK